MRLNISFVVGMFSRFMQKLCEDHWFSEKKNYNVLNGNSRHWTQIQIGE